MKGTSQKGNTPLSQHTHDTHTTPTTHAPRPHHQDEGRGGCEPNCRRCSSSTQEALSLRPNPSALTGQPVHFHRLPCLPHLSPVPADVRVNFLTNFVVLFSVFTAPLVRFAIFFSLVLTQMLFIPPPKKKIIKMCGAFRICGLHNELLNVWTHLVGFLWGFYAFVWNNTVLFSSERLERYMPQEFQSPMDTPRHDTDRFVLNAYLLCVQVHYLCACVGCECMCVNVCV